MSKFTTNSSPENPKIENSRRNPSSKKTPTPTHPTKGKEIHKTQEPSP
jgi:hypothetical protein